PRPGRRAWHRAAGRLRRDAAGPVRNRDVNRREQDRMGATNGERAVKLSCRSLWKIYGPQAGGVAPKSGFTQRAAARSARRLHETKHLAAVLDATFDVYVGEIFVIMGLSGSGKSTLVRCLSRLVEPTRGSVLLDGEDLLQANARQLIQLRRRAMGMVFQNFGLLPH